MKRSAAIVVLLFVSTVAVWAQTTSGSLVGTVTDERNAGVAAVSVIAIETSTNQRREGSTSRTGTYSISNLPPGLYRVEFQKQGFKTLAQPGIEVRVNETSRFNARLVEAGSLGETVTVEAPSPVLQTDTSSISATIDDDALQGLPLNGRQLES